MSMNQIEVAKLIGEVARCLPALVQKMNESKADEAGVKHSFEVGEGFVVELHCDRPHS